MVLLAAVAVAFEISAPAHAAVDSATPATSVCLNSGAVIIDKGDGYHAAISPSGVLEFVAASQPTGFCFSAVANTNFYAIYTPGLTGCLAWNATARDVYQHNLTGCGSNTNYMEWLQVPEPGGYYILQNQYSSGICFYSYAGSSTPVYGACNAASQADEFYFEGAPA
jgi:hypothetical protein